MKREFANTYSDNKLLTPSLGSDKAFGMAGDGFFERSLIIPCRSPKKCIYYGSRLSIIINSQRLYLCSQSSIQKNLGLPACVMQHTSNNSLKRESVSMTLVNWK